jgi:hypothetical protein
MHSASGNNDKLTYVAHSLFPSRVKMHHAPLMAKGTLLAMLHNTMKCLPVVCHRIMPEGIKSIVDTVNEDTHTEHVASCVHIL